MFDGGCRHLEQLGFGLVREALRTGTVVVGPGAAPGRCRSVPAHPPGVGAAYIAAGIFLYDQLGGAKSVPAQRHLTKSGA